MWIHCHFTPNACIYFLHKTTLSYITTIQTQNWEINITGPVISISQTNLVVFSIDSKSFFDNIFYLVVISLFSFNLKYFLLLLCFLLLGYFDNYDSLGQKFLRNNCLLSLGEHDVELLCFWWYLIFNFFTVILDFSVLAKLILINNYILLLYNNYIELNRRYFVP